MQADITFRKAEWHDRPVLSRMLELYQYDMSEVWQFFVMKRSA